MDTRRFTIMDVCRNRVGEVLLGDVCMGRRGSPLCCCDDVGGTIVVLFGRLVLA